jgi:hypothetical protein
MRNEISKTPEPVSAHPKQRPSDKPDSNIEDWMLGRVGELFAMSFMGNSNDESEAAAPSDQIDKKGRESLSKKIDTKRISKTPEPVSAHESRDGSMDKPVAIPRYCSKQKKELDGDGSPESARGPTTNTVLNNGVPIEAAGLSKATTSHGTQASDRNMGLRTCHMRSKGFLLETNSKEVERCNGGRGRDISEAGVVRLAST